ncbi:UNVERIFIED_CONTAM: hypothetical protein Slati_2460400 [Sesamum latifolium]|uniref:Uncharacterized protein n=1 Tax=Sesamum latifolium TaxID=2727402 RepID=A0AAW2WDI6_9LAMI
MELPSQLVVGECLKGRRPPIHHGRGGLRHHIHNHLFLFTWGRGLLLITSHLILLVQQTMKDRRRLSPTPLLAT